MTKISAIVLAFQEMPRQLQKRQFEKTSIARLGLGLGVKGVEPPVRDNINIFLLYFISCLPLYLLSLSLPLFCLSLSL